MKIIRLGYILIPLLSRRSIKWIGIIASAMLLFLLPNRKFTNWRMVYDEMSTLDESTIEMGFGIRYSEANGCYMVGYRQIDPGPALQKMKAAGFYWDGAAFKDGLGKEYSRSEVVQRLFPNLN